MSRKSEQENAPRHISAHRLAGPGVGVGPIISVKVRDIAGVVQLWNIRGHVGSPEEPLANIALTTI